MTQPDVISAPNIASQADVSLFAKTKTLVLLCHKFAVGTIAMGYWEPWHECWRQRRGGLRNTLSG